MVHYTIFSVVKLDLFIRALLLDRILVMEKNTRTPCVHLINKIIHSLKKKHLESCVETSKTARERKRIWFTSLSSDPRWNTQLQYGIHTRRTTFNSWKQFSAEQPASYATIQQTLECHKHAAGPGLAIAETETSRIPPNVVPPDTPQGSDIIS